jgi:aryl-alcohol dehydrogenase-like predicted oxidoreductase
LKKEGRIRAVGFGIYPIDLWKRIFSSLDPDAALVHNHYCLNDTRVLELFPLSTAKQIGIINASPFACGLLTDHGAPEWHPADAHDRLVFQSAAQFCRRQGTSIAQLALQFATQNQEIATTLFSSASSELVHQNVEWHEQPYNDEFLTEVLKILEPVKDKQWPY